jgi:glycosyltransferase involved in cell wall biosynthesis
MKLLYIDGVGPFGGASRSLFEAVRALPAGSVDPYFLAARGSALEYYRQLAVDVLPVRGLSRFDNTLYSHYRGVRWAVLLRELAYLPFSAVGIWAARRRWRGIDLIHANEVLELLPAIAAKYAFGAPLVVHVRSVQNADLRSMRYRVVCALLRNHADAIVAIDENVRSSLPEDLDVTVIHNSFTPKPAARLDTAMISRIEALPKGSVKIGFVGNLHESKGLFEMARAAKIVLDEGIDVDFVIVGGTTRSDSGVGASALSAGGLAQNVQIRLQEEVRKLGIADRFHFMGPTGDIQSVYERIDVICFASHYDTPGRPIFEAAFAGVPSIAAITKPHPDTLVPYETGIPIAPRSVENLAGSVRYFATSPGEIRRMGENARRLAEANFDPAKNSAALLALYQQVLDRTGRRSGENPLLTEDRSP